MPADLNSLADRVEREEPSRELDAAIHAAVQGRMTHPDLPKGYTMRSGADHRLARAPYLTRDRGPSPAYTTSLDAAVTLVPPMARWSLSQGDRFVVSVHDRTALFHGDRYESVGSSHLAALALTAAALRARAAVL